MAGIFHLFNPGCPCCGTGGSGSGSGSGAGSSGSTGPVFFCDCCMDEGLPDTLHVTFSNSGLCAGVDGKTFTLNYNADFGCRWDGTFTNQCAPFGDLTIIFSCEPGSPAPCPGDVAGSGWVLSLNAGFQTQNGNPVSCSCSPLSVVFHMCSDSPPFGVCAAGGFGCCSPGGMVTATVTL